MQCNCKNNFAAHVAGLHCTNTNGALDYVTSKNKWCVRFLDGDKWYDLIEDFTIRFWLKYTTTMNGRPMGTQKSAQLVLEYLICNPKLLANAWRNKLYRFSSGTNFKKLCGELTAYLAEEGNALKMLDVRMHH